MTTPVLYRALAEYKNRFHDPDLKRASHLWVAVALPVLAIRWLRDKFDLPVALEIASRILFGAVILLSIPLAVDFYEKYLQGSRIGFAGVCLGLGLAGPTFLVSISNRLFGTAIPSGATLLVLGGMMMCGIISGCVLVAIALLRNDNAED